MSSNVALYLALRLVSRVLPFIPVRLAHALASAAGIGAFYFFRCPRAGITSNLAVVLALPAGDRRVRAAARGSFQTDAKNWVDTLRIGRLRPEAIEALVDVHGYEHLEDALAQGRGVIVVSLHLGNYDLVGQVMAARGCRLTVPAERVEPEQLFSFLMAERRSQGINVIPIERAPREMLRALRAGEAVGITADRNIAGRSLAVDFFGRPAIFPRGPAALVRHSTAPVLMAVGLRLPGGRFHGEISAPLCLVRTENADADEIENTARLARVMETYIRRYPNQWLAFSSIWPAPSVTGGVVTIGQQEKAAAIAEGGDMRLLALRTPCARCFRTTIRSSAGPSRLLSAACLVDHPGEIGQR